LFTPLFIAGSVPYAGSEPGPTNGSVGTTRRGRRAEADEIDAGAKDNTLSNPGLGPSCAGNGSPPSSPALNTVNNQPKGIRRFLSQT